MIAPVYPQLLLLREAPAWLAKRGYLSPSGRPVLVKTIREWIAAKKIRVIRGFGWWRISEAELQKILDGEMEEPTAPVRTTKHRPRHPDTEVELEEQARRNRATRKRLGAKN